MELEVPEELNGKDSSRFPQHCNSEILKSVPPYAQSETDENPSERFSEHLKEVFNLSNSTRCHLKNVSEHDNDCAGCNMCKSVKKDDQDNFRGVISNHTKNIYYEPTCSNNQIGNLYIPFECTNPNSGLEGSKIDQDIMGKVSNNSNIFCHEKRESEGFTFEEILPKCLQEQNSQDISNNTSINENQLYKENEQKAEYPTNLNSTNNCTMNTTLIKKSIREISYPITDAVLNEIIFRNEEIKLIERNNGKVPVLKYEEITAKCDMKLSEAGLESMQVDIKSENYNDKFSSVNTDHRYTCEFQQEKLNSINVVPIPAADERLLQEAVYNLSNVTTMGQFMMEIKFYGQVGIVFPSWNDPREIYFSPGLRNIVIDNFYRIPLHFGVGPIEISIEGNRSFVHLGRPMRELYVDGQYFSIAFGGPPAVIAICGRYRTISLEGPVPEILYGNVRRNDLCSGRVNLIINNDQVYTVYLDNTLQIIYLQNFPCVLKFYNQNQLLINGALILLPRWDFPVAVNYQGNIHYIKLLPALNTCNSFGNMDCYAFKEHIQHTFLNTHQLTLSNENVVFQQPYDLHNSTFHTIANISMEMAKQSVYSEHIELPMNQLNPPLDQNLSVEDFMKTVSFSRLSTLNLRSNALIMKLHSGIQCSSCGIRFLEGSSEIYGKHLDEHFKENRNGKSGRHCRQWYPKVGNFMNRPAVVQESPRKDFILVHVYKRKPSKYVHSIPLGKENNKLCNHCGDEFVIFFDDNKEEWCVRDAVSVNGKAIHLSCFDGFSKCDLEKNFTSPFHCLSDGVLDENVDVDKKCEDGKPEPINDQVIEDTHETEDTQKETAEQAVHDKTPDDVVSINESDSDQELMGIYDGLFDTNPIQIENSIDLSSNVFYNNNTAKASKPIIKLKTCSETIKTYQDKEFSGLCIIM